jgi:high-affinity Fe2+/Pb2+ permease
MTPEQRLNAVRAGIVLAVLTLIVLYVVIWFAPQYTFFLLSHIINL